MQNGKVHGMELGSPITAQYDVTDDLAIDMIAIRSGSRNARNNNR